MSKQKQKGTAFETLVVSFMRDWWPGAERRAMQGALDKGDLLLPGEERFVCELKNVARMDLAGWAKEAEVEAINAGAKWGVVIHKRKGRGQPGDQWVTMSLATFCDLVGP